MGDGMIYVKKYSKKIKKNNVLNNITVDFKDWKCYGFI